MMQLATSTSFFMSSGETRRSRSCEESASLGCKYGLRRAYLSQKGSICTTRSFIGWKFGIGSTTTTLSWFMTALHGVLHASPVTPLMFIEHDPQIAERHERRNEIEPSTSALAVSSASRTVVVAGISTVTRSRCGTVSTASSKRKISSVIFAILLIRSHLRVELGDGYF